MPATSAASPPAPRMKRKPTKKDAPALALGRELWAEGHEVVVGVDEVGRGAWAGPLSVGAAVLPQDRRGHQVRGPKKLPAPGGEAMFDRIAGWCTTWAVGHASYEECDELGM